jgi:hypothetical protein
VELPKRLFVVVDAEGVAWAGRGLADLPEVLLPDGVEVGIYRLGRVKKVEITRKLKALNGEPEELPLEPEPVSG